MTGLFFKKRIFGVMASVMLVGVLVLLILGAATMHMGIFHQENPCAAHATQPVVCNQVIGIESVFNTALPVLPIVLAVFVGIVGISLRTVFLPEGIGVRFREFIHNSFLIPKYLVALFSSGVLNPKIP